MTLTFLLGFSGEWGAHPLGAIISLVGGGWAIYLTEGQFFRFIAQNSKSQNLLQYIKWLAIPVVVLLVLWLLKSIWVAFAVGFVITISIDRRLVKERGINRIAALLILYLVVFLFLLVAAFKIEDASYPRKDIFFDRDSYILLRNVMRGL